MSTVNKPLFPDARGPQPQRFLDVTRRGTLKGVCDPVPHFDLSPALFDAMSYKEVMATIEALAQCDLLALPYPLQTIRFNIEDYACADGWGKSSYREKDEMFITAYIGNPVTWTKDATGVHMDPVLFCEQTDGKVFYLDVDRNEMEFLHRKGVIVAVPEDDKHSKKITILYRDAVAIASRLLIAALATKNVSKQTGHNPRATRGHGSGRYRGGDGVIRLSRTVLDVPTEYTGTGKRVRFHLRRGHIHHFRTGPQHHGPLVARFLPPIFVNADMRDDPISPVPKYEVVA